MELNSYIDHTNLKNTATKEDIQKLCEEAIEFHFASVCVAPYYVELAKELLSGSNVQVCTVVGFPLGTSTTQVKSYEAIDAVENGADEIDMVINIAALKNKDYDYVKEEIEEVRDSIDGKVLKVIIETCLLTDEEIIKMTEICNETYVNFIKTSTGTLEGAKVEDVELINKYRNNILEIKASGGIRNYDIANEMIEVGATRIGTSHGVKIMTGECNCNHEHCHCEEGHYNCDGHDCCEEE